MLIMDFLLKMIRNWCRRLPISFAQRNNLHLWIFNCLSMFFGPVQAFRLLVGCKEHFSDKQSLPKRDVKVRKEQNVESISTWQNESKHNKKLAVIVHAFYIDEFKEMFSKISFIKLRFSLYAPSLNFL